MGEEWSPEGHKIEDRKYFYEHPPCWILWDREERKDDPL